MPKLLQINTLCNWGSTGKIAEQIGLQAQKSGYDTCIAHGGRYINESSFSTIQIESKIADYWHCFWNSFILGHHGLGSKSATLKFIKEIERYAPDIVHLHNLHGYYINYKILFDYLNKTDIPIVWTLHDTWAFTGHCGHFGSIDCEKWKIECNHCPLKMRDYPKSIRDCSKEDFYLKKDLFTSNKNLHLVPVSTWLGKMVKQSFLKDLDIRVITNGIDLNIFKPYDYKRSNRTRILGVASQWGPLKGIQDFYILRQLLPLDKYEIMLVGLNDKQIQTRPWGINGVKRTESIEELARLYSSADIFINLTYADTLPTVNIESLACGTPIITYKTGGSPEILDEGTGFVVEKGKINEIVEAINLFELKGKQFYTKTCRQRAIDYFNKDERFQDYINLYNELLNEKSCSR